MRNGEIDQSLPVQALSPLNDNSMSAVFRNSDTLRIGGSRTSVRASNANLRKPDSSFYTGRTIRTPGISCKTEKKK